MKATSSIASILHPDRPQGVMLYNGRPYAVGLLWFTVQEDTAKSLLQQRVNKTKADFYCLRQHISQQQGFGWMDRGHRRGMAAAAAMVADQLVGEWHGVFEADNGWWYVQVRSDTITPNGDRFFTSEEDAFQLFQEESQKNIWPHSYAPEKWSLSDTTTRELSLRNLLDNLAMTTLTPTNITAAFGSAGLRNTVLGGLSLAFVAMAGVAVMTMLNPANDLPPPPTSVRTVNAAAMAKKPEVTVEAVSPQQLLQQCGDAIADLYVSIPGWDAKDFACAVGKAVMTWQQGTGLLSDAKNEGMAKWPQGVAVTFQNRLMTAMLTLGNLPKLEPQELFLQDQALIYLEQKLQSMGTLQVKTVIPPAPKAPPPLNPNDPPKPAPPAPPPYLEIQFASGFDPQKIAPLLNAPGLELSSVTWHIVPATWNYALKWTYKLPARTTSAGGATPGGAATGNNNAAKPAAAAGEQK